MFSLNDFKPFISESTFHAQLWYRYLKLFVLFLGTRNSQKAMVIKQDILSVDPRPNFAQITKIPLINNLTNGER